MILVVPSEPLDDGDHGSLLADVAAELVQVTVPVPQPRATITDDGLAVEITVPARHHWAAICFIPVWLCGWAFGEWAVVSDVFHAGPLRHRGPSVQPFSGFAGAFEIVWLTAWTIGGALALYTWVWMLVGDEHMRVDDSTLAIWRKPIPIPRRREFDLRSVRRMRVSSGRTSGKRKWNTLGQTEGRIAFDYGSRTFHFGEGIDEAEAWDIVAAVARRFPTLAG